MILAYVYRPVKTAPSGGVEFSNRPTTIDTQKKRTTLPSEISSTVTYDNVNVVDSVITQLSLESNQEWNSDKYHRDLDNSNLTFESFASDDNLIEKYSSEAEATEFVSAFNQNLQTTILGAVGNRISPESKTHHLLDFSSTHTIFDTSSAVLKVTSKGGKSDNTEFYKSSLKVQNGDIIKVMLDEQRQVGTNRSVLFTGYVTSVEYIHEKGGKYSYITCKSFLERLKNKSYLQVLNDNGIDAPAQTRANRNTSLLIQQLRLSNYLGFVPVYHDLQGIDYFALFNQNDSQYDVLSKLANQFMRFYFERKDGSVYITQLYNSKTPSKRYFFKDIQTKFLIHLSRKVDYSQVPYKTRITYTNAPMFIKEFTAAEVIVKNYPNPDSPFSSLSTQQWDLPNTATSSTGLSNLVFFAKASSVPSSNEVSISLPSIESKENGTLLKNLITVQAYNYIYPLLRNTIVYTMTLPFVVETSKLEIGDLITLDNDSSLVIVQLTTSLDTPVLHLTLIPLSHTSPIFPLQS